MNRLDDKYQNLKNAKIMIVDDEPINIDVVQAFLEDENYFNFIMILWVVNYPWCWMVIFLIKR